MALHVRLEAPLSSSAPMWGPAHGVRIPHQAWAATSTRTCWWWWWTAYCRGGLLTEVQVIFPDLHSLTGLGGDQHTGMLVVDSCCQAAILIGNFRLKLRIN